MRSRIIAAARLTALLLVLTLITGMSGYSCVGPAEFSSGLPAALSSPHDRRITGSWYALDRDGDDSSASVLLYIRADGDALNFLWDYTYWRPCVIGAARPRLIDGTTYYDVTLGVDAAGNKDPLCGSYTPAGTAPGHVIVRARVDGDRLFLRFVRNDTLLRLRDLGHFEARVVETGADVESYLLADLSADELVALLRGVPADALFNDWVGPLHRLNTRRLPTQGRLTSPSGSLLQAEK